MSQSMNDMRRSRVDSLNATRLTHRQAEHTITTAFSGTSWGARQRPHWIDTSTGSLARGFGNLCSGAWGRGFGDRLLNKQQFI